VGVNLTSASSWDPKFIGPAEADVRAGAQRELLEQSGLHLGPSAFAGSHVRTTNCQAMSMGSGDWHEDAKSFAKVSEPCLTRCSESTTSWFSSSHMSR